jgi:hypothetical protein
MAHPVSRLAALICAAIICAGPFVAATAPARAEDDPKAAEAKAGQRKVDEIAEAARAMTGPAANPECVWHGIRIVGLLWNDDVDAALRQLELYDRFNCPSSHIQATFRCFLRQGPPDPKAPDPIKKLAKECWMNPGSSTSPATAATTTPTPSRSGTSNR